MKRKKEVREPGLLFCISQQKRVGDVEMGEVGTHAICRRLQMVCQGISCWHVFS